MLETENAKKRQENEQLRQQVALLQCQLHDHTNSGKCLHATDVGGVVRSNNNNYLTAGNVTSLNFSPSPLAMTSSTSLQHSASAPNFAPNFTPSVRALPPLANASVGMLPSLANSSSQDQSLVPSPFTPKTVTMFSFDSYESGCQKLVTSPRSAHSPVSIQSASSPRPPSLASELAFNPVVHAKELSQMASLSGNAQELSYILGNAQHTLTQQQAVFPIDAHYESAVDEFLLENC